MDTVNQVFLFENREQLQIMKNCLLQMETNGSSPENVNALFHSVHTIFCAAISSGDSENGIDFKFIVEFTHVLENVLDEMRSGTVNVSLELAGLLLVCSDHLGMLMNCVECNCEPDDYINKLSHSLHAKLQHYHGTTAPSTRTCLLSEPPAPLHSVAKMDTFIARA